MTVAEPVARAAQRDSRRIFVAQALRALAYGFGAIVLGVSLAERGWSSQRIGALFMSIVAGTALLSVVVGTWGDRIGRRRLYVSLYLGLALAGLIFALTDSFWLMAVFGLTGTLSTEVVESGPFTSLEQSMLANTASGHERTRLFGRYNAIATLAGATGALLAGGPALIRDAVPAVPTDQRFLLIFVPIACAGAVVAASLSGAVEAPGERSARRAPLGESRPTVLRLCGLFAVDAFAGGFVVQAFIAYWFSQKYGVSIELIGLMFFIVGLTQTASFLAAPRLAERFGLLNTMVFTHLPSNILLMAIPFAPTFGAASLLLFARSALSQMDVPTRQAYIAALVTPEERTAAAGYTSSARYATRPFGALLAGVVQQIWLGLPFLISGGLKSVYDIALWGWLRRVRLPAEPVASPADPATTAAKR